MDADISAQVHGAGSGEIAVAFSSGKDAASMAESLSSSSCESLRNDMSDAVLNKVSAAVPSDSAASIAKRHFSSEVHSAQVSQAVCCAIPATILSGTAAPLLQLSLHACNMLPNGVSQLCGTLDSQVCQMLMRRCSAGGVSRLDDVACPVLHASLCVQRGMMAIAGCL